MKTIPLLAKEDIDCRIGQADTGKSGKAWASILLYKNARVDMRVLDEVFTPMGWQREHDLINGNLFCSILLWDDVKKQWIRKQDVGTESKTEKEKGEASDSFKRAGTNVGIGRELYTAPRITVSLEQAEYTIDKEKVKVKPVTLFSVGEIAYNEERREITQLVIVDKTDTVRFKWGR
jgi:hypothetical protein